MRGSSSAPMSGSTPFVQDLLKQASRLQSLSMPASVAMEEAEVHGIHTNLSVDS